MILLDATLLKAFFDADDPRHEQAVALLDKQLDEQWAAEPLTLMDFFAGPLRAGEDRALKAREHLGAIGVREVGWPQAGPGQAAASGLELASLRAETGLSQQATVVLWVAETQGAAIGTFDDALVDVARRRGVSVIGRR